MLNEPVLTHTANTRTLSSPPVMLQSWFNFWSCLSVVFVYLSLLIVSSTSSVHSSSNNLPGRDLSISLFNSSHCWRVGENVTAVILCSCNSAIFSVNEQLNTHDWRVLMLELVTSPILIPLSSDVKHLSWQQYEMWCPPKICTVLLNQFRHDYSNNSALWLAYLWHILYDKPGWGRGALSASMQGGRDTSWLLCRCAGWLPLWVRELLR